MVAYHRGPLSLKHRMAIAASRIGIPLAEYQQHIRAGLKWCAGHHTWHAGGADTFYPRPLSVDGLDNVCKEIVRARARETMRRLYARRRAERLAS
jgi:hypothetical protein